MCAANYEDHENKTYTRIKSEEFLWIFVHRQILKKNMEKPRTKKYG